MQGKLIYRPIDWGGEEIQKFSEISSDFFEYLSSLYSQCLLMVDLSLSLCRTILEGLITRTQRTSQNFSMNATTSLEVCNPHQEEEDGKTLVCDKRDRGINCEFCRDLHLSLMFSGRYKKIRLKESEVWLMLFQAKLL